MPFTLACTSGVRPSKLKGSTSAPLELRKLNIQMDLLGDRLEIRKADADLNGGKFTASGKSGFSASGLHDSSLTLRAEKVQLEYPEGLQSEINTQLTLAGDVGVLWASPR